MRFDEQIDEKEFTEEFSASFSEGACKGNHLSY